MPHPAERRALIIGALGQDGAYLTQHLLSKGYAVAGTSRNPTDGGLAGLRTLGLVGRVEIVRMNPADVESVRRVIAESAPNEVYALAGQSSVGLSFAAPAETVHSTIVNTLNILEVLRTSAPSVRLFHASSAEIFGDLGGRPATERTRLNPRSPYGVAKAAAHLAVASYRDVYGIFAVNGILFNHESPLRPEQFVTRKVTSAAKRIADGAQERLELGKIDIARDWGWAPEFVEAMWLSLQQNQPDDYIIATGETHTLAGFVAAAFSAFGLNWRDHADINETLARPFDPAWSGADINYTESKLGWRASTMMPEVARLMALGATVSLAGG